MKTTAALFLGLSFLLGGNVFAANANTTEKPIRTAAFETGAAKAGSAKALPCGANSVNCNSRSAMETASCGAFVANDKYHGYGFGFSKAVATGKAHEMCGPNACKVVVAACED